MATLINTITHTHKKISLYKFVRYFLSGDNLVSCLYVAYINMLTGLCTGESSAQHCFMLLQNNSHYYYADAPSTKISWDHIFHAFARYLDSFRSASSIGGAGASFDQQSFYHQQQQQQQQQQFLLQQQQQQQQQQQYRTLGGLSFMSPQPVAAPPPPLSFGKSNMSQQEMAALTAVVRLVNQIALHSEKARLALCEYQRGMSSTMSLSMAAAAGNVDTSSTSYALNQTDEGGGGGVVNQSLPALVFGLVSCASLPTSVKAELVQLLASLALTPSVALSVWQLLEASQLVPTITGTTATGQQLTAAVSASSSAAGKQCATDLRIELEENESRDESYPLLGAFLSLIRQLLDATPLCVADTLGMGVRAKSAPLGFQPYLQFLVNSVYLKCFYRSYKRAADKWRLMHTVLHIFHSLVAKYTLNAEDFVACMQQRVNPMCSSAASTATASASFRLIYELIHDGPLIRTLFLVISDSLAHLLEYNGGERALSAAIESCSLSALRLVASVLDKQPAFARHMRTVHLSTDGGVGIERLIVAINPATNRADYLVAILRYIQFNASLGKHARLALHILYALSNYSAFSTQLLDLFVKSGGLTLGEQCELMSSFVDFVEEDEDAAAAAESGDESERESVVGAGGGEDGDEEAATALNASVMTNDVTSGGGPGDWMSETSTEPPIDGVAPAAAAAATAPESNQLKAIKFLLLYLRSPSSPNIAHLLLGFDIHKPLRNQVFFSPGTKISYGASGSNATANKENVTADAEILSIVPRTCLHSVIAIINKYVMQQQQQTPRISNNSMITLDFCYQLCKIHLSF